MIRTMFPSFLFFTILAAVGNAWPHVLEARAPGTNYFLDANDKVSVLPQV